MGWGRRDRDDRASSLPGSEEAWSSGDDLAGWSDPRTHPSGDAETHLEGTRDTSSGDGLTLSEERLRVESRAEDVGSVKIRKRIEEDHFREVYPRGMEEGSVERERPAEGDSGEVITLPDGSVSVPVFEERIFVERRLVVKERIVVRKHTITEDHVVEAELRREVVDVDVDESLRATVGQGT